MTQTLKAQKKAQKKAKRTDPLLFLSISISMYFSVMYISPTFHKRLWPANPHGPSRARIGCPKTEPLLGCWGGGGRNSPQQPWVFFWFYLDSHHPHLMTHCLDRHIVEVECPSVRLVQEGWLLQVGTILTRSYYLNFHLAHQPCFVIGESGTHDARHTVPDCFVRGKLPMRVVGVNLRAIPHWLRLDSEGLDQRFYWSGGSSGSSIALSLCVFF